MFKVPKDSKDKKEYSSLFNKIARQYKKIITFKKLLMSIKLNNKNRQKFRQSKNLKNKLRKKIILRKVYNANNNFNRNKPQIGHYK